MSLGVLQTQKLPGKRNVYAAEDNVRRARELAQQFSRLFQAQPMGAICAEAMSFPRNSSAAAKVAMCWGVLSTLAEQHQIPILQLSPQEVKKAVCGTKDAAKKDIQYALEIRYGEARLHKLLAGVAPSSREHAYDALAVVVACMDSEAIRLARRISSCAG